MCPAGACACTDLARGHRTCGVPLSETVDRYDQRSCHTEYRNNDTGDCKADHLPAALMWRRRCIKRIGKPPVPQESVNRKPGSQEREANPENDVQVPQCWVGLPQ